MQAYLKLDHIDKVFTRGAATTEVLKDINLTIEKGDYVSIIGHSGCGKSTLLNIVAGLTDATQGGVLLENREVNSPGPDRAVVFQNHSLLPWLTVYENVKLGVDKVFAATKTRAERADRRGAGRAAGAPAQAARAGDEHVVSEMSPARARIPLRAASFRRGGVGLFALGPSSPRRNDAARETTCKEARMTPEQVKL